MAREEEEGGYTWETAYERTWEVLQEDESGSLEPSVLNEIRKAKRKRLLERKKNVKLGIMRHVFVVLDMSQSMQEKDMHPNRQECLLRLLDSFVDEFFDQNPISQLGFIITQNSRSEKVTDLTGNARKHKEALESLKENACLGEPSLQNSIEMAMRILRHIPSHASREIIVILGSLATCDPSNIKSTIETLKRYHIRCSVVGLVAEVYICKLLSTETKGSYSVMLDEQHLKDILTSHTIPAPALVGTEPNLIRMGFPDHKVTPIESYPSMCAWKCFGCFQLLENKAYVCDSCEQKFCIDCDVLLHESVQSCPGCTS